MTVVVNGDVDLPANAVAAIQQSSLLGEKYVELAPPGNAEPAGDLREQPARNQHTPALGGLHVDLGARRHLVVEA